MAACAYAAWGLAVAGWPSRRVVLSSMGPMCMLVRVLVQLKLCLC